jgi:hypothetical protein
VLGVVRNLRWPRSLTHPAQEPGEAVALEPSVVVGMTPAAKSGLGR